MPKVLQHFGATSVGDYWRTDVGHVLRNLEEVVRGGVKQSFNGWVVTGWNERSDRVYIAKGLRVKSVRADEIEMRFRSEAMIEADRADWKKIREAAAR